jgi:hypothetical protein
MSFSLIKSWDNRKTAKRADCTNGRTWTRRIRWLVGERIKLKLEDGVQYQEILTDEASAKIIWDRFKEGQSIEDSVGIFGDRVPTNLKSKKAE